MRHRLHHTLCALSVALLSACGGGGSDAPEPAATVLTVSIYGDSFTATNPSTADQLTRFSGDRLAVTSYSVGGATTVNALSGLPLGYLPFENFQRQMDGADASGYTLIRYGIAEAMGTATADEFASHLHQLVAIAKARHRRIALVNLVELPVTHAVSQEAAQKAAGFNAVVEQVAAAERIPLIDIRSHVSYPASRAWTDGLHPLPDMTTDINHALAAEILRNLAAQ